MRRSPLPFAAVSLSALLCACGFMTPAQQYAGDRKDPSEIAVVRSYQGSPLGDEYHATISGHALRPEGGPAQVRRLGLPGFTDYPRELHLNPGRYTLDLYCFKSLTKPTFRPSLDIVLESGFAYMLKCEVANGQATVLISQATRP